VRRLQRNQKIIEKMLCVDYQVRRSYSLQGL